MKRIILFLTTAIFYLSFACTPKAVDIPQKSSANSSLSSITLKFPDKNKDIKTYKPEALKELNGYRLVIKPVDGCINPKVVDEVNAWETVKMETQKITQGCDYYILLNLGSLNSDKKSLAKIFFTNDKEFKGTLLQKENFLGKSQFNFPIILNVTDEGISAGFTHSQTSGGTGSESTDLSIEATIEQNTTTPSGPSGIGTGNNNDIAPDINLQTSEDSRCSEGYYFSETSEECVRKYHRLALYHDPDSYSDFFGMIRFVHEKTISVCFRKGSVNVAKWGPISKKVIMVWIDPLRSLAQKPLANDITFKKEEEGCGNYHIMIEVTSSESGTCEMELHPVITFRDGDNLDVFTHEMGHAFGLDDIFHGPSVLETDDPNYDIFAPKGSSIMIDLAEKPYPDDIRWLKRLYVDFIKTHP